MSFPITDVNTVGKHMTSSKRMNLAIFMGYGLGKLTIRGKNVIPNDARLYCTET